MLFKIAFNTEAVFTYTPLEHDDIDFSLRNEFIVWNVHGIMDTSGLLQSK